tara:strand:- start:2956 stop:3708 length:753 start_codon:yes stop_codon:yes gene_type:complete
LNFLSLYKRKFLYKIKKKINIDEQTFHNQNLEKIFSYYGTDKASTFNDGNNKGHGFTKFYEEHFFKLRNKEINILEVGSYSGASAAAFSKYFPNSKVFCLDVNISNFKYSSKKIKVFGLDVSQKKMIDEFFKEIKVERSDNFFDIIIDDGSHKLGDILITFKYLFDNLRKNGFYVIEDYKFPNYFKHLDDIAHDKIDLMIDNLKNKKIFNSNILDESFQKKLHNSIKNISVHQGNSEHSNIAFIEKNVQF